MLSFNFKKRYFFSTIVFGFSHLLAQSDIALAQMRLGRGIQPGLEGHLIEYQIQQQPLNKMQGISGCSIGFGVGCNKTASLLQKIITESSGKTYQDILWQAAGGQDNYLRFSSYYPQNINLNDLPLNSFWLNGGDYVLDSHQYSGIEDLDTILNSDFHSIVSQFTYAPIASKTENLNLQQGLIGLKTAYGRELIKEASNIPNLEHKIAASGLSQEEINFHWQQFLNSVEAIERGNQPQINHSLYELLSNPYTSDPGVLNRPSLGISSNLDRQIGIGLEADEYITSLMTPSQITPEVSQSVILNSADVTTFATGSFGSDNTPLYLVAGIGGLTLLALLLADLEVDSNTNSLEKAGINGGQQNNSGGQETPQINPMLPEETPPEVEIPTPPSNEVTPIPETNNTIQFLILVVLTLFVKRRKSTKNSI